MTLTPALFTSSKADGTDPSKLRPSNWNRLVQILNGVLDGADATGSILLRDATDATDGASWLPDVAAGSVLVSGGVGAAPAWSATPTLTSLTLTAGSGSQTGKVPVVIFTSTTPGANVSSAETDLISYPMPANTLAVNGQKLRITIFGTTAANANGKTVRFYFGGTMIGASGISVAYNGLAWQATAYVIRTGAATQVAGGTYNPGSQSFGAVGTNSAPAETLSNPITIKVTGQSGNGAGSNDITALAMMVEWLPA
jgi:hypothetical protein